MKLYSLASSQKQVSKEKGNHEMTNIIKIAKDKNIADRLPNGEALALQVKVLQMHLKDNPKLNETFAELIKELPSPRQIRQDFSQKECEILYETVEYLWKNIAGEKLVPEKELYKAPESLQGNYWLLPRGLLLHGLNHYSIAKQNSNLVCSLLGIGPWAFQEHLCSKPNNLVWLIMNHGGVRLFITKDKRLYAQMSSEGYAKIGRSKIRKLDFKLKVVKLIDLKAPYNGWKSGITIKL